MLWTLLKLSKGDGWSTCHAKISSSLFASREVKSSQVKCRAGDPPSRPPQGQASTEIHSGLLAVCARHWRLPAEHLPEGCYQMPSGSLAWPRAFVQLRLWLQPQATHSSLWVTCIRQMSQMQGRGDPTTGGRRCVCDRGCVKESLLYSCTDVQGQFLHLNLWEPSSKSRCAKEKLFSFSQITSSLFCNKFVSFS